MSEAASQAEYSHFFQLRLDLFDGPIDLLLHLVKQNELPIERVSLAEVTSQYLACIEAAPQFDLEVAGEYLVMAATLLTIKSSVLLNEPVQLIEDEDGNLVDPHEELLKKLREAEIYKSSAIQLGCRELLGVDVFAPVSGLDEIQAPPVALKQHDPILLGMAFKRVLDKLGTQKSFYTVTLDSVSIVERMMFVLETLKKTGGRAKFEALIPDVTSKGSLVGSFLALLELCKRQAIKVRQENNFKDIYIILNGEGVTDQSFESEFDTDETQAGDVQANG